MRAAQNLTPPHPLVAEANRQYPAPSTTAVHGFAACAAGITMQVLFLLWLVERQDLPYLLAAVLALAAGAGLAFFIATGLSRGPRSIVLTIMRKTAPIILTMGFAALGLDLLCLLVLVEWLALDYLLGNVLALALVLGFLVISLGDLLVPDRRVHLLHD